MQKDRMCYPDTEIKQKGDESLQRRQETAFVLAARLPRQNHLPKTWSQPAKLRSGRNEYDR